MGDIDGLFHLGGGALRDAPFNLPGSRVMHVDGLIAAAQAHLPANKVTHGFHVSPSFKSAVAWPHAGLPHAVAFESHCQLMPASRLNPDRIKQTLFH
jgi:hypothetical protein